MVLLVRRHLASVGVEFWRLRTVSLKAKQEACPTEKSHPALTLNAGLETSCVWRHLELL